MEKINTDYEQRKPFNRNCAPLRSNDVVLSSFLKVSWSLFSEEYPTYHSNFSWTILSKGESYNEVNFM